MLTKLCRFAGPVFLLLLTANLHALEVTPLKSDHAKVKLWNDFTAELYALHQKLLQGKSIKTTETDGGYYELPKFYHETSYYDASNNRLLSRIQRETQAPDNIHQIEVFIYDAKGVLVRDYLSGYLPKYRNAPIYTFINLHHYDGEFHGFRQFDASGVRIHEQCRQGKKDEVVLLLNESDLLSSDPDKRAVFTSKLYKTCFGDLPLQAGKYLSPSAEFPATPQAAANEETKTPEDLQRLIAQYSDQLRNTPTDATLYVKRADAYAELQEFDSAIEDYSRALHLDNSLDAAYFGRGLARGRGGYLEAGIADLSIYLQRHPADSRALTKRGVRYIWKGDELEAEQDLKQAIAIDNKNAEAHDDLGVIYARRGDYAHAIEHFKQTIQYDPSYQKGYHNLALGYLVTKQQTLALDAIDAALRLRPDAKDSLMVKAQILAALGRHDEAKRISNEAEFLPEGNWSEHISVQ
ncbi:MAG: tetratricopeptide repeat protein [Gammaproteobacteria bacterium]|nr:tetratricopeptide repeat protein [Gammaproteobacteria bacterium]